VIHSNPTITGKRKHAPKVRNDAQKSQEIDPATHHGQRRRPMQNTAPKKQPAMTASSAAQ